jgi:hypothetical protein
MADRGSILISTANDIGEALVEKLGGEGYAPSVWDKEYNKLGIAEVDSAPALSVLEDSSETGTARGSILLSTANAIGAMLNKKYNTDRGFKPKEWASAASKLAPLPEKTAESSPVCSIEDGADDVPSRSLVVTIPPTLTGESQIIEKRSGRNFLDTAISETKTNNSVSITCDGNGKYTATGTATGGSANITFALKTPCTIKSGMYLHLMNSGASGSVAVTLQKQDNTTIYAPSLSPANRIADLSSYAGQSIYSIRFYISNGASFEMSLTPMICFSSAVTTYEPYIEPTTYTADLGRTINGGTADIVNGTGSDNCTNRDLVGEGFTWSYNTTELSFPYFTIGSNAPNKAANKNFVCEGYVNRGNYRSFLQDGEIGVFNNTTGINRFCIRDDSCTTLEQFLEKNANTKITYEVTNPVEFTFDGQEIPTKDGYNAFWSDQGNTALDYYGAPEPYTRGTASGAIANVQSARTDLPFTKVKANIAPSLTGTDEVEVVQAHKNISSVSEFPSNPWTFWGTNFADMVSFLNTLKKGTYTISFDFEVETVPDSGDIQYGLPYIRALVDGNYVSLTTYSISTASAVSVGDIFHVSASFTLTDERIGNIENCYLYCDRKDSHSGSTGRGRYNLKNIQIEVGSSPSTYEPYRAPTTYTAELEETVYGGSVDLVSGEVKESSILIDLSTIPSSSWNLDGTTRFRARLTQYRTDSGWAGSWQNTKSNAFVCENPATSFTNRSDYSFANIPQNYYNFDVKVPSGAFENAAAFSAWLANYDGNGTHALLVIDRAEAIESSIPGQVIVPSEGVNNLWNNAGGDTDVEYFTTE